MQESYLGVDLSNYNCHKLVPDTIYSNYAKEELHFPIGAIQKGLKPHTWIGIKRIKKRNQKKKKEQLLKKLKKETNEKDIKPLVPKSPEQICMKSLRTQFRHKIENSHVQAQKPSITKTQKQLERKRSQKKRRRQLLRLVKDNHQELLKKFGDRMNGFGCYPKVSRKQIKEFLKIQDNASEVEDNDDYQQRETTKDPRDALPDMKSEIEFPTLK